MHAIILRENRQWEFREIDKLPYKEAVLQAAVAIGKSGFSMRPLKKHKEVLFEPIAKGTEFVVLIARPHGR